MDLPLDPLDPLKPPLLLAPAVLPLCPSETHLANPCVSSLSHIPPVATPRRKHVSRWRHLVLWASFPLERDRYICAFCSAVLSRDLSLDTVDSNFSSSSPCISLCMHACAYRNSMSAAHLHPSAKPSQAGSGQVRSGQVDSNFYLESH